MKIREFLFRDFKGCTNHDCIITGKRSGAGTNGSCNCITDLTRGQLSLLKARLSIISEEEISIEL